MNFLKSHVLFLVLILCGTCFPAFASDSGASLTVYNGGRALVHEVRTLKMARGVGEVVIPGMPRGIDPDSVLISGRDLSVLDMEYRWNPISPEALLKAYVGREISVILPDPGDADGRVTRKATLLSAGPGGPVFRIKDRIYVGRHEALIFPDQPEELQATPELAMTVDNRGAKVRPVDVSYFLGGLDWNAEYALLLDEKGNGGRLECRASVRNDSGSAFKGAHLRLIAGDVQRQGGGQRMFKAAMAMNAEAAPAPDVAEQAVSGYHMYSVDRPVSIPARGVKQISLFSASLLNPEREYVAVWNGMGRNSGEIREPVRMNLAFDNIKRNGLGIPLPAGIVRVYDATDDGVRVLAGESRVPHVASQARVNLALGEAFDLDVRRVQTSFSKVAKNEYAVAWKIVLRNGSDSEKTVLLRERLGMDWEITKSSMEFRKMDAATAEFVVNVPPSDRGGQVEVTYTATIRH
ncbi:DUF4139 domain-containing protein [Pseudodesulfovibrio tunisiensis]|uniref:DUF4139 domain-containing protein n=1 Tax=Pseudodesulfovibrio tunisiensis TaxID=463192 RepID=UPI002436DFD2|nr:DUF4139 domain-containing protein [Pseudodesulfovibrio tunisiensis]